MLYMWSTTFWRCSVNCCSRWCMQLMPEFYGILVHRSEEWFRINSMESQRRILSWNMTKLRAHPNEIPFSCETVLLDKIPFILPCKWPSRTCTLPLQVVLHNTYISSLATVYDAVTGHGVKISMVMQILAYNMCRGFLVFASVCFCLQLMKMPNV